MIRVRNKENYSFVLQFAVYETLCNRDMSAKSFDAPVEGNEHCDQIKL